MNHLAAFSSRPSGLILSGLMLSFLMFSMQIYARDNEPTSLGAYFGPLVEFRPNARIMVVYAEGEVMFVAREELKKQ